ncbi:MAG: hypothetical protein KatS3mg091_660 [Patescibacteria group bacterium]|nr:MAG: hypothetical protein KatS3mg091_660 [Patescibacteria group bacterium]
MDGKEYVVGVYRVTGLDGTPYVFPLKAERYENGELRWDFKSASRVLAEAQGVLLGNNDEAWRSDLGEKLEYFGTIAMAEGFAGTEGYRIRFNESDLPYIEEAYERVRTIINRGGYPFFKTSIVPSFLNGVPPDLDKAIKSMSVEDVERLLRGHVERVMTYQPNKNAPKFKDLVDVWEIVGEVNPYYIQRGWNRHPFIEKFAKPNDPDFGWKKFFEIVFRTAQQIDPDALLIVSNYNNEYPNDLHPGGTQKQTLEIIRYLKSIGINNVGVGLHMHLNLYGDHVIPTPPQFANVIRLYRSSGAEPIITEFDLNISTKPHVPAGRPDWWPSVAFNPNTRYADQARIYYDLVKTYLEETRGQENRIISWWGRRDNHSWIELGHKVEDADPLLFDHNGKPKPAFFAVSSALYESLLEKFD